MLSKYTILHDKTKLEQKGKKCKKVKRTWTPPGGMGSGLERAYSKLFFFFYYWLQYQKTKLCTLVLVIWDPKSYNKLVTS